jgi:hypothetical protein
METNLDEIEQAVISAMGKNAHCVFSETEIRYTKNSAETQGILKKAMLKMFVGAIIGGSVGGGVITWAMKAYAGGGP